MRIDIKWAKAFLEAAWSSGPNGESEKEAENPGITKSRSCLETGWGIWDSPESEENESEAVEGFFKCCFVLAEVVSLKEEGGERVAGKAADGGERERDCWPIVCE